MDIFLYKVAFLIGEELLEAEGIARHFPLQ